MSIFGVTVHPFAVLVGLGMLLGFGLAVFQGRRYGLSRERIAAFSVALIFTGLIGARLGRVLYQPELVAQAPAHPGQLLLGFRGIASFGAYFGGLAGAFLFFRFRCASRVEPLAFLDSVGFALPFGWLLGRVGCALVHDHPGSRSTSWLSVAYPDGARYDLGLLEAIFLFCLAGAFLILRRRARPAGFYFSVYGPVRFLLDRLHIDPPRYFGWTVDQYGALAATFIGLFTWFFIIRFSSTTYLNRNISHAFSN